MAYLPHGDVVETVGTVEDHTEDSDSFGQILGGLCLACPGWPFWRAVQVQVERSDLDTTRTGQSGFTVLVGFSLFLVFRGWNDLVVGC